MVTMDTCSEFTFLSMVISEALRLSPPVPAATLVHFEQDVQLGNKLHVKAYTALSINITAMCYNAKYWQRPYEFLPDRFDPQHELSKTPSG